MQTITSDFSWQKKMSIENCLPESARQHYLRVRNQKSNLATQIYQAKLVDVRSQAAQRGTLRSGYQELAEWKLVEEFFEKMAYGWFEAATETCKPLRNSPRSKTLQMHRRRDPRFSGGAISQCSEAKCIRSRRSQNSVERPTLVPGAPSWAGFFDPQHDPDRS